MKNFTEIPFTINNLDKYYIRNSIYEALKKTLPHFKGSLLDVGCGKMPYKDFILSNSDVKSYLGLDIESEIIYDFEIEPDLFWDGKKIPLESNSFDCVICTEVLEHCPEPEIILKEIGRVLKPNGILFFTVPFLWNLHETPFDEYRYTPFALERHLKNSNFEKIFIAATGGWHASMAQMLGLWVRRSPMPQNKRKILSNILKPIIKYLIKIGSREKIKFTEGQMITGLYGTAKKVS
jgi:SAM-dependent methyltransferase